MKPELIFANTDDRIEIADQIVEKYHGYVASRKTVGRCLKYLIAYDGRYVGTIWIGSGFKPTPKDLLNFFGMNQKQFDAIFNTVADNKRFCLTEKIENLGTQTLKMMRDRIKSDWFSIYGDELQAIITTVGGNRIGSVYLADNWKKIGSTSGLPKNRESVSMKWDKKEVINMKYVQPTGEDKKTIFITTKLKTPKYPAFIKKINISHQQIDLLF
jgi:hypothetical protein